MRLTPVLVASCGLAVANLYYAQPLLSPLSQTFHTSQGTTALVVTLLQGGFVGGLIFLLPLGDLYETRRLVPALLTVDSAALLVASVASQFVVFAAAALVVGMTCVAVHILIPFAAQITPEAEHGRIVGYLNSGLMLGILLARTLSSLTAAALGSRAIFLISSALMITLAAVLAQTLPRRRPAAHIGYRALLTSVARLITEEPLLRRRAIRQASLFAVFSMYWTSIAYELIDHHGFTQTDVGLFALVGAVGVCAAPLAGRLADRGADRVATGVALLSATAGMLVANRGAGHIAFLGLAAILLDIAMTGNQVVSQRAIYRLRPDARARITTAYMSTVFVGGAIGSAAGGALYSSFGWQAVTLLGLGVAAVAAAVSAKQLSATRPRSQ